MLKLFYDHDLDYLEIFYKKTPNYGEDIKKGIIEFKSESNDKVVGHGFYNPIKNIMTSNFLDPKTKIAIMCFIKRKTLGLSEKDLAAKLGMSYRTYQRIEEGSISKIDDLIKISQLVSDLDISKLLKVS
jgi:hypothetical protein